MTREYGSSARSHWARCSYCKELTQLFPVVTIKQGKVAATYYYCRVCAARVTGER